MRIQYKFNMLWFTTFRLPFLSDKQLKLLSLGSIGNVGNLMACAVYMVQAVVIERIVLCCLMVTVDWIYCSVLECLVISFIKADFYSLNFPHDRIIQSNNVKKRSVRHVRPAKIQIRLRSRAVWSESSLGAFWIAIEDSDQTACMRRLVCVFVWLTCQTVHFHTLRLIVIAVLFSIWR